MVIIIYFNVTQKKYFCRSVPGPTGYQKGGEYSGNTMALDP